MLKARGQDIPWAHGGPLCNVEQMAPASCIAAPPQGHNKSHERIASKLYREDLARASLPPDPVTDREKKGAGLPRDPVPPLE